MTNIDLVTVVIAAASLLLSVYAMWTTHLRRAKVVFRHFGSFAVMCWGDNLPQFLVSFSVSNEGAQAAVIEDVCAKVTWGDGGEEVYAPWRQIGNDEATPAGTESPNQSADLREVRGFNVTGGEALERRVLFRPIGPQSGSRTLEPGDLSISLYWRNGDKWTLGTSISSQISKNDVDQVSSEDAKRKGIANTVHDHQFSELRKQLPA